MTELRLGDWREALSDIGEVDAVITDPPFGEGIHGERDHSVRESRWAGVDALIVDPPYGERTHVGHDAGVQHTEKGVSKWDTARRRKLTYAFWTPEDVKEFVDYWSPRTRGWLCAFSCSDLFPAWNKAATEAGRVVFAPIPCVIRAMSVRLSGDGPSNWAVYLNVSRPRGKDDNWGTRVGAYVVNRESGGYIGGKPKRLMDAIVRDYSKRGELVCDPCAGYATTAIAAESAGRNFIGAEVDPETHARALERLANGVQMGLSL